MDVHPRTAIGRRTYGPVGMESPTTRPMDGASDWPYGDGQSASVRRLLRACIQCVSDAVAGVVRAARETNEHVFDLGRHSTSRIDEYGDTQRSCSSRASCKGVSPCPHPDPEALT